MRSIDERCKDIKELLENKKGEEVTVINTENGDYFVQRVVIATALSDKHTAALLDHMKEQLKPKGEEFLKVQEGDEWIVVDLGDILVHLMTQAYRNKYKIEDFLHELMSGKNA
ncbi:ribosome-associated protein [Nitratiruptor sp. YY08-26]|uniref:ribosome silencing factor n=1 Tax=unclassified Nitratiruptor TaxID=2624044 RepID=UPI0019167B6B|nr:MULTISPECIES: ribosome silencing factor [unclassified Nitratiruptor]BCD62776.1 ribosome-associated protein [Nitratiruptor sp. YY08-13]BCD66712.1 ribosome-associated protein [Nitratiruptor sp. YY08-26]